MPESPTTRWRKSSRSVDAGNCVEIALIREGIAIRDSKNPDTGTLHVTSTATVAWITGIKANSRR